MKNLFLIALTVLVFSSCKKSIETLPVATETGANTFGAKINAENWGPLGFGVVPTAPILEARFWGDSSVFINVRNFSRSPVETEMEIYLENIGAPGIYALNQNTAVFPNHTASYAYYLKRNFTVDDEWITSSAAPGQVQVTKFDRANKIISGSFSFTANAKYGSAPIVVTEGRFDVKIQ
ncbi:MAG TPA: DUF6252 family protein [Flavisolibacter sp.]|jgi:hypothetical protein|nr:DUF6252 family protein [Flavisolibacter sp.]